jgi:hypothetical protein
VAMTVPRSRGLLERPGRSRRAHASSAVSRPWLGVRRRFLPSSGLSLSVRDRLVAGFAGGGGYPTRDVSGLSRARQQRHRDVETVGGLPGACARTSRHHKAARAKWPRL